jgi:DNA polymerase III subunit gamma/tau
MSLYRKYRPQTFEDVVGQEHIAQTLRHALAAQPLRVAHAYLFCGPRGTGKTTTARLLAKCLNCEKGPTPTPCNECDFCVRVRDNQAVMDLIEIDAASNTGVDNVRENIIEKVNMAPAQGRYRVYIIDEVHMLSTSSFNALLKTLEEPPPHAVFVLATTDVHKVPPTITSRCQRFDFRRVGPADIVRRLQYVASCENIALQEDAARLIAHTADGALRDALTLLEQVTAFSADAISEADVRLVLGTVSQELLWNIVDAVANRDAAGALRAIERATEEGVSFSQLTRDLTGYCRDLLLLTVGFHGDGALTDAEKKRRHQHAQLMGRHRLMNCVEALRAAEKEMRQSTDHRLLLELTLVRQANPEDALQEDAARGEPASPAARVQAPVPTAQPALAQSALRQPSVTAPPRAAIAHAASAAFTDSAAAPNSAAPSDSAIPLSEAAREAIRPASAPPSDPAFPYSEVARLGVHPETSQETEEGVVAPVMEAAPVLGGDAAPDDVAVRAAITSHSPEVSGDPGAEMPARKKGRRINTLDEFVELWPAVLARVKRKIGVTAVAYLHDASPVALDAKEAVLEFKKEFHYEKACEALKRLPFEQVLNECMATPHRLRLRLAPPPKPVQSPIAETPAADDDDDEDDVLRLAQDMFGAEVVGRSGTG